MKSMYIFLVGFLWFIAASGQTEKRAPSTIVQQVDEKLASGVIYRYINFSPGIVFFKNNSTVTASLNYNLLAQEMQFIDPKGDTLSIADIYVISFITIGNDSFYLDKGVQEIIGNYPPVKLAVKVKLREVDRQKIGGYGIASSTSAITSYNSLEQRNKMQSLSINEQVVYSKEYSYFIMIEYNRFLPITKNNVVKAFPSKGKLIEQYFSKEQPDLKKEDHIKKLLTYASGL